MPDEKISGPQAVILLFLSATFNILNYIPAFNGHVDGMSFLIGMGIAAAVEFLALIPALLLSRRCEGENVVTAAYSKWRPLGVFFAVIYALQTLLQLIGSLIGFEYFLANAVYPNSSAAFIILTMCAACFFAERMGIEGLARAASIIFVFFLLSTLLISFGTIGNANINNLRPTLEQPVALAVQSGLNFVSKTAELYLFLLLFPKIKGNKVKSGIGMVLLIFLFSALTSFLVVAVLGDFGQTQTFPYYSLASISDISVLQRLDALHMTIWVFVAFLRITLLANVSNYCLQMVLPLKAQKYSLPALFLISAIVATVGGYFPEILPNINISSSVITLTLTAGFPLLLLCFTKRRKKEARHEEIVFDSADRS